MKLTYSFEYLSPGEEYDEYETIDLDCEVQIHLPEPDVGILSEQAEIISCKDSKGNDFMNIITDWDVEAIELMALDSLC